jgi:hypothetical protein
MDDDSGLWWLWQGCFERFRSSFTEPGFRRFVEYLTGLVLDPEEHTVTQAVTSLGRECDWAAVERFLERGRWESECVEAATWRTEAEVFPDRWHGYRVVAVDDTKVHRTGEGVWGTCTFHEYTARCPNRAETVRAHNWVVAGGLIPGRPWQCLLTAARLYFRRSQLPRGERFVTKTTHAVNLLEEAARTFRTDVLGVFDGAYAMATVVRPLMEREPVGGRIDVVSRLRVNARLYELPPLRRPGQTGRPRKWGRRLPAPEDTSGWANQPWQEGRAFVYGRERTVRWTSRRCLWYSAGPTHPVTVVIAQVEGYTKRWYLVTSSERLTGLEVVEVFAARFRQEDAFRALKQRLGAEECRAWTKAPIIRTFQAQMVALTLLRLLAERLDEQCGVGAWWSSQPWYQRKTAPSVRDVIRLLRRSVWGFGHVGPPNAMWSKPSQIQPTPGAQPSQPPPPRRKAA